MLEGWSSEGGRDCLNRLSFFYITPRLHLFLAELITAERDGYFSSTGASPSEV